MMLPPLRPGGAGRAATGGEPRRGSLHLGPARLAQPFSKSGLILSMFVEKPATGGRTHDDCFNYYWPRARRNPLIEPQSVQVEHGDRYTKVTYRSLDIPNVNYYFCFKDSWVDLHLSLPPINQGEQMSLSDFESRLRYGEE